MVRCGYVLSGLVYHALAHPCSYIIYLYSSIPDIYLNFETIRYCLCECHLSSGHICVILIPTCAIERVLRVMRGGVNVNHCPDVFKP